ncbi:MAG: RpoL/Rpb11 RNA polymerase subunit family protein [Candidatus Pacearchaeota archaeon]
MEVKILKEDKNSLEIEIDNLTIAEIVRKYLWLDKNVSIAGWKREHPTKPIVLVLKTKGDAKRSLLNTIEKIRKEGDDIKKEIKKIKL